MYPKKEILGWTRFVNKPEDKPESDAHGDEGFLSRWARRKQAAGYAGQDEAGTGEDSETLEQVAESPPESPEGDSDATEAQPDATPEPPGDEDMPPLESIDEGGSVAAFLSPKVSASLRRTALRRLWRQPEFSGEDMLDDYALDYTKREPLGDIVTAEMKYRAEQLRKRMERKMKEGLAQDEQPAEADEAESVAATEQPVVSENAVEDKDASGDDQALAGTTDAESGSDERASDAPPESGPRTV